MLFFSPDAILAVLAILVDIFFHFFCISWVRGTFVWGFVQMNFLIRPLGHGEQIFLDGHRTDTHSSPERVAGSQSPGTQQPAAAAMTPPGRQSGATGRGETTF